MFTNDGSLSLTTILGPILGRIIYSGVNTNDLIQIMRNVEKKPLTNAAALAQHWMAEWSDLGEKYIAIGETAEKRGNILTAQALYYLAAVSFRAGSLINSGGIEAKTEIHRRCVEWYRHHIRLQKRRIEPVTIPYDGQGLTAYLHLPDENPPFPCAVMFGGVGGCKEELHGMGKAHAARGMAVLAVDLPGLGESLLIHHLRWRLENLTRAIDNCIAFLRARADIQTDRVGVYGLCLGGAMAYKYASRRDDVAFCTTMFPMLINRVVIERSPAWMKMSEWFAFFCGDAPNEVFEEEMTVTEDLGVSCPYLLVHGSDDNWTPLASAMKLYDRATAKKDHIIVKEKAVHESGHLTTHTIPVADQYHWVIPVASDRQRELLGC